ncbi:MAG TPA: hypothetical protein VGD98_00385 [Ktedonobacteraceae bacterium]
MKRRGIGLIVLLLCVLSGLVVAIFTPALAMNLTLPAAKTGVSTVTGGQHAQPVATTAATATKPAPTVQPTLPSGVTVLAQDTFQRNDQAFWGVASDQHMWEGDANNSPAFTIADKIGQISGQLAGGQHALQATFNVMSNDAELFISGSVSQFDANGNSNLGAVLRWQDTNNWYKALIDGTHLQLLKSVKGKQTVLAEHAFQAIGGTKYGLRFRIQGSNLFARAWPLAQQEPATWTVMDGDTQFTSGMSGIRVKVVSGVLILVTAFRETSVPQM